MIRVHELKYQSNSKWSLDIPSLHWSTSQTHAIIGLSGSGKTTLLKILQGLLIPTHGTVSLGNLKSRGYVIQEGGLFPHLTLKENLLLPFRSANPRFAKSWSFRYKEEDLSVAVKDRINYLLDLVSLPPDVLRRFPHEISGGQRQRIGVARALALDPELILMDEPLAALDPLTKWELKKDLRDIFDKLKKTVFMVTHDMNVALYFGHTLTVLHEGRVVQSGNFEEVVSHPVNDLVQRLLESGGSVQK